MKRVISLVLTVAMLAVITAATAHAEQRRGNWRSKKIFSHSNKNHSRLHNKRSPSHNFHMKNRGRSHGLRGKQHKPSFSRKPVTMPHQTAGAGRPAVTMPKETAGWGRPGTRPHPGNRPPRPRRDINPVQGTSPVYVPWAGNWRGHNQSSQGGGGSQQTTVSRPPRPQRPTTQDSVEQGRRPGARPRPGSGPPSSRPRPRPRNGNGGNATPSPSSSASGGTAPPDGIVPSEIITHRPK